MVTISFPGLGIDNFTVNKVAFSIGPFEIRWYALIIAFGLSLAVLYCWYRSKYEGISVDDLLDMVLFGVPCAIVGARLYYVLTTLSEYNYDSFLDVIAIWEGGIAIYGAIIAGGLTIFFVCRHKKIKFLKAFDMVAPAVMIGQIIGRWGNFFNGEAYGAEVAEGSLLYFIRMGLIPNIESRTQMHYFHPTFLYESLWNLVGFIIINALYKKKKFDGQVFFMYISWYGFGRMFIEGLRTDSLYVGVFRISQVIGFLCFVVGSVLLIYNLAKAHRSKLTAMDYDPAYPKFAHTATTAVDEYEDTVTEVEDDIEDNDEKTESESDSRERYQISKNDNGESVDDSLKNLFFSDGEDDKKDTEQKG